MIIFIANTLSSVYKAKNVKIFTTGVLFMLSIISIHAEKERVNEVYYGNMAIYGKNHLFAEPSTRHNQKLRKSRTKKTYKAALHDEKEISTNEPITHLSDYPPAPSSPFSSYSVSYSALIVVSQNTVDGYNLTGKATLKKIYLHIKKPGLPVCSPNRRQKLSTAATQYGALTSFGSQSPPLEHYVIART